MTLKDDYNAYKKAVAAERKALRRALELELAERMDSQRIDLAYKILELKRTNSVEQILEMLGVKNRNTLYEIVGGSLPRSTHEQTSKVRSTSNIKYDLKFAGDDTGVLVSFAHGDQWVDIYADGDLGLPDEWLEETDPNKKALYRKIIQEIEGNL